MCVRGPRGALRYNPAFIGPAFIGPAFIGRRGRRDRVGAVIAGADRASGNTGVGNTGVGMDQVAVQLVVGVIMGTIVAIIANNKGRNAVGWFFIGMFTGCIGLILVLVLPDLKKQHAKFSKLNSENRRMREELRLNRQVADRRHDEVSQRLGVHDRALGVETGVATGRRLGTQGPPSPLPGAGPGAASQQWWYERDGERVGPVSAAALREEMASGTVNRGTLVWRKGLDDWAPVREIDELRESLGG